MPEPDQQEHPEDGIQAIVAGPLYVDLITGVTYPPASAYHTELRPSKGGRWRDERKLGGTGWKFAVYWAENRGPTTFVTRIERPWSGKGDSIDRAFLDDGRWLRARAEEEAAALPRMKKPRLSEARGGAQTDYTFHLVHPWRELWPILTIAGGAARQLTWADIVETWQAPETAIGTSGKVVIFLSGVLRTGLPETLAQAIRDPHDPHHQVTTTILERATLAIDFGRTDLRRVREEGGEKWSAIRSCIRECIQSAHLVMVDTATASALGLLEPDSLPEKGQLIARPHGVLPGQWWRYRRTRRPPGKMERMSFEAPTPEGPQEGKGNRPRRVAELVWRLVTGRHCPGETKWSPYATVQQFTEPEQITLHGGFLASLRALRDRVRTDERFSVLLIYGPTGTGKEVVARWLHRIHPSRGDGPFLAVPCGRMEGTLVEDALFGHVIDAFSGANAVRPGAFITADGGFLLIDDLDALPLRTQAKLLRVIEDGEVTRLGTDKPESVDVFLVATTNIAPEELVRQGKLRKDLYFRLLSGGYLEISPFCDRPDDAIRIAKSLWERSNTTWSKAFAWPKALEREIRRSRLDGNCRSLDAAVECMHQHTRGGKAADDGVPDEVVELLGSVETQDQADLTLEAVQQLERLNETLADLVADRAGTSASPRGRRRRAEPPTAIYDSLLRASQDRRLGDISSHEDRFGRFLRLWEEACERHPEEDTTLSRRQIMQCMQFGDRQVKAAQTLLRDSRRSHTTPRVQLRGAGVTARWEIIRSE